MNAITIDKYERILTIDISFLNKVLHRKIRKQFIFSCSISHTSSNNISLGSIRKVFSRLPNLFEVLARCSGRNTFTSNYDLPAY